MNIKASENVKKICGDNTPFSFEEADYVEVKEKKEKCNILVESRVSKEYRLIFYNVRVITCQEHLVS